MPHWNGIVVAETPEHLKPIFAGKPSDVEAAIREEAKSKGDGTEVIFVSWESGKWNRRAHVLIEGPSARDVLEHFAATHVHEYKDSEEKDRE